MAVQKSVFVAELRRRQATQLRLGAPLPTAVNASAIHPLLAAVLTIPIVDSVAGREAIANP